MPKKGSNKRKRDNNNNNNNSCWSGADHAIRQDSTKAKRTEGQNRRTAALTHNTNEKRSKLKLKLHMTRTKRHIDQFRKRLEQWDPVDEKKRAEAEEQKRKAQEEAEAEAATLSKKKRKPRAGPETWKLKGAARPAHLVYDFDTRYQCPHQKALDDEKLKQARLVNLLKQPTDDPCALPVLRDYMSVLMQWGHLNAELGHSPLPMWKECLELEARNGMDITTACNDIVQFHLERKEYLEARDILEKTQNHDTWSAFAKAWIAVELGQPDAEENIARAIQVNPFCAFWLSFLDIFESVFEYKDEIEAADDVPQSSLEEAIEYSANGDMWRSNGADKKMQQILVEAREGRNRSLSKEQLEWRTRLRKIEEACQNRENPNGSDVSMFAEMFRTSMEMVQQSGIL